MARCRRRVGGSAWGCGRRRWLLQALQEVLGGMRTRQVLPISLLLWLRERALPWRLSTVMSVGKDATKMPD